MKVFKFLTGLGTSVMALIGGFYSIAILVFLIETVKESEENGGEIKKSNDEIKPLIVRTWRRKYSEIPPRNEERRYGFR